MRQGYRSPRCALVRRGSRRSQGPTCRGVSRATRCPPPRTTCRRASGSIRASSRELLAGTIGSSSPVITSVGWVIRQGSPPPAAERAEALQVGRRVVRRLQIQPLEELRMGAHPPAEERSRVGVAARPGAEGPISGSSRARSPGRWITADEVDTRTSRSIRLGVRTASCWATTPPCEMPARARERRRRRRGPRPRSRPATRARADSRWRSRRCRERRRRSCGNHPARATARPRPGDHPQTHDEQKRRALAADLHPRADPVDDDVCTAAHDHLAPPTGCGAWCAAGVRPTGGGLAAAPQRDHQLNGTLPALLQHFPRGREVCGVHVLNEFGMRRRDARHPVELGGAGGFLLQIEQVLQ